MEPAYSELPGIVNATLSSEKKSCMHECMHCKIN